MADNEGNDVELPDFEEYLKRLKEEGADVKKDPLGNFQEQDTSIVSSEDDPFETDDNPLGLEALIDSESKGYSGDVVVVNVDLSHAIDIKNGFPKDERAKALNTILSELYDSSKEILDKAGLPYIFKTAKSADAPEFYYKVPENTEQGLKLLKSALNIQEMIGDKLTKIYLEQNPVGKYSDFIMNGGQLESRIILSAGHGDIVRFGTKHSDMDSITLCEGEIKDGLIKTHKYIKTNDKLVKDRIYMSSRTLKKILHLEDSAKNADINKLLKENGIKFFTENASEDVGMIYALADKEDVFKGKTSISIPNETRAIANYKEIITDPLYRSILSRTPSIDNVKRILNLITKQREPSDKLVIKILGTTGVVSPDYVISFLEKYENATKNFWNTINKNMDSERLKSMKISQDTYNYILTTINTNPTFKDEERKFMRNYFVNHTTPLKKGFIFTIDRDSFNTPLLLTDIGKLLRLYFTDADITDKSALTLEKMAQGAAEIIEKEGLTKGNPAYEIVETLKNINDISDPATRYRITYTDLTEFLGYFALNKVDETVKTMYPLEYMFFVNIQKTEKKPNGLINLLNICESSYE